MDGDLLDTAPCGYLSFADDGRLLRLNRTLLDMLGYERDELIGRHVENIFTTGTRIFYQTHWFPLLRMHGRAEEIFLILRSRSGEEIGVLANGVRREGAGEAEYDCIVMRVRERQKFEAELLRARRAAEEANVAKSRFLAVMSHELRTPLNAISGYVQLLEMGIHGPVTEAQREVLGRLDRSQKHLLKLINDVLDLARIEAGRMEFFIEDVLLADVVSAVLPIIEPLLAEKNLSFESTVPGDLRVRADREKTQQILLNLLGNAVKFTDEDGRIDMWADSAGAAQDFARLHVRDTGIGIPADKLGSIFEPFVQVGDTPTRRSAKGSGLGLAISRDLARGMGGDLSAESSPGEGSTFTLTLPLVA
jgi:PAS domain S-box-containing protein